MKLTKKSFREATKLKKIWNHIIEWNGLKLATVLWQYKKEWKIVNTSDFDLISDRENKNHIIYETHTQEELWRYIKDNKLDITKEV